MLLEEIIELLPHRGTVVFRHPPERTISELEMVTEIASILIENPLRLRLAALIVALRVVVTAVEATAEIRPAERTDVFPADNLGDLNFFITFMAQRH